MTCCGDASHGCQPVKDVQDCFVTTDSDLQWAVEEDETQYQAFLDRMQDQGFHMWPDHVPAPLPRYKFEFYGPLLYSRPRCSFWHRLWFRLPSWVSYRIL